MCLDFPELQEDYKFNNAIGITYHNDNVFEEMKQNEIEAKRIASFQAKKGITNDDGTPYFATEYLIRKELKLTEDEISSNKHWLNMLAEEAERAASEGGAVPPAGGGGGAAGAGGETPAAGEEVVAGGEIGGEGQL
jgi:hypothetical protein